MKIVPSILANNIDQFIKYLKKCADLGVDEIQIDIADGQFVDNKTVSINEIKRILGDYNFKLQFHLMVENISKYIDELEPIDPEIIFIHPEALDNNYTIKSENIGLAINPETHIESIQNILSQYNSILIMTVKPGFYGGKFLTENLKKIDQLRKLNYYGRIGIDGGINTEILKEVVKHQPDFVCSGGYLLNNPNSQEVWEKYRHIITNYKF